MKFLVASIILLISISARGQVTPYLGVDVGFNGVGSHLGESSKTGASLGAKGTLSFDSKEYPVFIDTSLGYQYTKLSGSTATIKTYSLLGEADIQYRLNSEWSVGPTLRMMSGTDTTATEEIGESSTSYGLYVKSQYKTHMGEFPVKLSAAFGTTTNLNSNIRSILFGLQITLPSKKTSKVSTQPSPVKPVEVKSVLVFFETNEDSLTEGEEVRLAKLGKFLSNHKDLVGRIKIAGHTDISGNYQDNKALSQNRADTVLKVLIKAGVSEDKMSARGFSSIKPRNENQLDPNRRTEIEFFDVKNRSEFNKKLIEIMK